MVETTTKNYGWIKPEIQHSPTTWGGYINQDLDAIDALVFANQVGIAPVGSMMMYCGTTAPPNWLMCDGLVYQNSAIPALAPLLANRFNAGTSAVAGTSSAVPNLGGKFPLGVSPNNALGSVGGAYQATITVAQLPAHAHPITDVGHNHTVNQTAHGHGVSDPTHIHGVGDPGHAHPATSSQAAHNHGLDNQALTPSGGGNATAGAGWLFKNVRTDTVQPAVTTTITAAGTGVYLGYAATGIAVVANNANISLTAAGTGLSTTQNAGSGAPISIVPPYVAVNFIIRYQ